MIRHFRITLLISALSILCGLALGADAPHDQTQGIDCDSCHTIPLNALALITTPTGGPSLCLSCHTVGSVPYDMALQSESQAIPGISGYSHRWDSNLLQYVHVLTPAGETGSVALTGDYAEATSYTLSAMITSGGAVGVAQFAWADNWGNSGTDTVQSSVAVGQGLSLLFEDHPSTTSFPLDMRFEAFALPLEVDTPAIADALSHDIVVCNTCHDQHANTFPPFLRVDNSSDVLCASCHPDRSMGTWADDPINNVGNHPTGVLMPSVSWYATSIAPLELEDHGTTADASDDTVQCLSCHSAHHGDSNTNADPSMLGEGDGNLLRMANDATLCKTCHLYEDHSGLTCSNCHEPHGASNKRLVRDWLNGQPATYQSADDFLSGSPDYDGVCERCHTATAYHQDNAGGDHSHYATTDCMQCHSHVTGFVPQMVDCLSCHRNELNVTADGIATRSISEDFENEGGHHPFTYDRSGDLSDPQNNNCLICHLEDSYDNPLHGDETVDLDLDPDGSGDQEWQTYPGSRHSWCVDCHDGDNPNPAYRLSGLIASDKSDMATVSSHRDDYPNSGAVFGGLCDSCHDDGHRVRVRFYSPMYGGGHEEETCYGCHGGFANVSVNEGTTRYMENMKVAFVGTGAVHPRSQHMDPYKEIGDGAVVCRNCHDPHRLDHDTNLLCDPDDRSTSWGGDVDNAWCLTCHDGTQADAPLHLDIDVTGVDCASCHLAHASTNKNLLLIDELSTYTLSLTPDPASVPVNSFQQFQPVISPSAYFLSPGGLQRQADWGLEGLTGGSAGQRFDFDANIPFDRTEGYDPSGWGLINVTDDGTVSGGPSLVTDLNVFVDVPHHYRGDLEVWLRNLTTGEEAQIVQSNWNDGTDNLYKIYDSESPNAPNTDVTELPGKTGTGILLGYINRDGYTGPNNLEYTITITAEGDMGTALFDWSDNQGGSATDVVTSLTTPLQYGAMAGFYHLHAYYGGVSPQFKVGDSWTYKPMAFWNTAPDSLTVFNDRNSNGDWQIEVHDTWPSDNPTDPASPSFCYFRSWALLFNSGLIGTIDEQGLFKGLFAGTGRVQATLHHGRIWPIQSGLSDFVFEDPLPISATSDVTVTSTRAATSDNASVSQSVSETHRQITRPFDRGEVEMERRATWAEETKRNLAATGLTPHAPELLQTVSCASCHKH
ncbi:hypothetical protein KQI84_15435 [bacterium]|nr:hypothetical protein [bacterium]